MFTHWVGIIIALILHLKKRSPRKIRSVAVGAGLPREVEKDLVCVCQPDWSTGEDWREKKKRCARCPGEALLPAQVVIAHTKSGPF